MSAVFTPQDEPFLPLFPSPILRSLSPSPLLLLPSPFLPFPFLSSTFPFLSFLPSSPPILRPFSSPYFPFFPTLLSFPYTLSSPLSSHIFSSHLLSSPSLPFPLIFRSSSLFPFPKFKIWDICHPAGFTASRVSLLIWFLGYHHHQV